MGGDFNKYLFLVLIIVVCLFCIVPMLLIRAMKRKKAKKIVMAIDGGNVSVFFDRNNNVTVIPYSKDKYGVGRAVAEPVILNQPYSSESLGNCVKKGMRLCNSGNECQNNQLMAALGYPGWKEFSVGRRNISVHYHAEQGVVMNTTIRRIDGSYQFNHFGFEKVVAGNIGDKEFGDVLLELLLRCRA